MARITIEHHARVYDDDHGWYVEIGPDRDGLDLCRIAYVEPTLDDRANCEIIVPWEHAEAIAKAISSLTAKTTNAS